MPDRYATADERLRFLAAAMHNEAVELWNLAHLAEHGRADSRGEAFPHREAIEGMQRTLSAIAWPAFCSVREPDEPDEAEPHDATPPAERMTDAARRVLNAAILRHNGQDRGQLPLAGWEHYAAGVTFEGVSTFAYDRADGRMLFVTVSGSRGPTIDRARSILSPAQS